MPITHQSKMPVTMLVTICLAASSLVIDGRFYNTNRRICSRNIPSPLHSHSLSGQAPHVHFSPSATYFCSWFGPTSAAEKLILAVRKTARSLAVLGIGMKCVLATSRCIESSSTPSEKEQNAKALSISRIGIVFLGRGDQLDTCPDLDYHNPSTASSSAESGRLDRKCEPGSRTGAGGGRESVESDG